MEIILAKHAGFCEGVKRAYKIALDSSSPNNPLYMLSDLVHNSEVVNKLKEKGIITISDIFEIPEPKNKTLMISAHGVAPEIYEEVKGIGIRVADTTCPWVKKAQKIAADLSKKGYQVIIVGDEGHPEVKGLVGWADGKANVIANEIELDNLSLAKKVGVIAQTTQSEENFNKIVKALKKKNILDLKIHNTICDATEKRQKDAIKLARSVDLMLVTGDLKSANTKRLTELCKKTGVETHQIQTADELSSVWFLSKNKVGVTAGTSTPDWIIVEVIERLKNFTT